jgi:release factor glutamine methyltransferase
MAAADSTVAALTSEAAMRLRVAGIEEPRREARWLLAHVLAMSESSLFAHPDDRVTSSDVRRFRDTVTRRVAHEPFAYVVREREFYGRTFGVDRRVLVPRPETELLITESIECIERHGRYRTEPPLVVDVGTGSGAIACTLALESPSVRIVASDVSGDALAVAALNRDRLGLWDRLALVRGSLLSWLHVPADLVVANLPYIPSARVTALMPEVAQWEPHLALDGGADGLDLIRALLADVQRVVRRGGMILLEMDPEQIEPARALLPAGCSRVIGDLAGLDRVLRFDLP